MTNNNKMLLGAAVAGLMSVALTVTPASAKDKKADKNKDVKCTGVNKCKGMGQCGGQGHECAGKNTCKGQGWLHMPKSSCEAIEGGTVVSDKKGDMMKDDGMKK